MNKILINNEEWTMILKDYNAERYFDEFIFDQYEFVIRTTEMKEIIKIKYENGINKVNYRYIKGHYFNDEEFTFIETEKKIVCSDSNNKLMGIINYTDVNNISKISVIDEKDTIKVYIVRLCHIIRSIRQYIMNESYDRKVIVKESMTIDGTADFKDLKKKIKVQKKQRVVCLLKDIVNYATVMGHKEIHCECWSVRGHFRHYKNGKVVWIKNYEKGIKRNTGLNVDKTYVV